MSRNEDEPERYLKGQAINLFGDPAIYPVERDTLARRNECYVRRWHLANVATMTKNANRADNTRFIKPNVFLSRPFTEKIFGFDKSRRAVALDRSGMANKSQLKFLPMFAIYDFDLMISKTVEQGEEWIADRI